MIEQLKKPGVAFWATVVVVGVLIGYPLSFGPACWTSSRTGFALRSLPTIYHPIVMLMARRLPSERQRLNAAGHGYRLYSYPDAGFYPDKGLIERYACLWAPEGWRWRWWADF